MLNFQKNYEFLPDFQIIVIILWNNNLLYLELHLCICSAEFELLRVERSALVLVVDFLSAAALAAQQS